MTNLSKLDINIDLIITSMEGNQVHVPTTVPIELAFEYFKKESDCIHLLNYLVGVGYSYVEYMMDNEDYTISGDAFQMDAFEVHAYLEGTTELMVSASSEM